MVSSSRDVPLAWNSPPPSPFSRDARSIPVRAVVTAASITCAKARAANAAVAVSALASASHHAGTAMEMASSVAPPQACRMACTTRREASCRTVYQGTLSSVAVLVEDLVE